MIERQELHCHNCNKYVQFDIDLDLDGNHVLNCPNCNHEHCRVIKNGKITDFRWDTRNPTYQNSTNNMTFTTISTFSSYSIVSSTTSNDSDSSTFFTYTSWMNTVKT